MFQTSYRARFNAERIFLPENVRRDQTTVKLVNKIHETYRSLLVGHKELRIRELETERIRQTMAQKNADLGKTIVSAAVHITNIMNGRAVEDLDRIFVEGDDPNFGNERQNIEEMIRALRFLYASDVHEERTPELTAMVDRFENQGA